MQAGRRDFFLEPGSARTFWQFAINLVVLPGILDDEVFVNFFSDCHFVLASSFLFFNKCTTPARLALSHRKKKYCRKLKFKTSVWFKSMNLKLSNYFLLLLLFLLTSFADGVPRKVLLSQSSNINSFSAIEIGAPNENMIQNHLNIALLNVF